ncbi:hypothetical protein ADK59_19990 [Streptomyces sp. XY332]|nr:hypothetical protein ADK59_19990 [Streptomyces sp. XY332]THA36442.1 hypothetical protein E6W17_25215 [Streptomyces sp. A1547]
MVYMTNTQQIGPTAAPAPRWAVRAAHATALLTLPSGIWRLLLAAGFLAGYTETGYAAAGLPGWGRVIVAAVSVGSELLALLTLGLVRPWGEVLPSRVPFFGGRRVPPRPVTVVAGAGAVVLTCLWTPFLLWWTLPNSDMTPVGATVVGFLYLPLVAWGPLLAAVTVSYHRRHRRLRLAA